jgi:hypothetical protein
MLRRLARAIAHWHHRGHIRDLDWQIAFQERQLAALPGEIRRLYELRRYHIGRASSLAAPRCLVNWNLGRAQEKP